MLANDAWHGATFVDVERNALAQFSHSLNLIGNTEAGGTASDEIPVDLERS